MIKGHRGTVTTSAIVSHEQDGSKSRRGSRLIYNGASQLPSTASTASREDWRSVKWKDKESNSTDQPLLPGASAAAQVSGQISSNNRFEICSFRYHIVILEYTVFLILLHTPHSSPRRLAGEKKSCSYNHKITIWVSH